MTTTEKTLVREAVAVFHDEKTLQAAIDDLETHGFGRTEISLLAPVSAVEKKLGHHFVAVTKLEDDTRVPTVAYISPESRGDAEGAIVGGLLYVGALAGYAPILASGGALAAALTAMAIAGGGTLALGVALARLLGKHHAEYIADQLEHGGLLLWVRTWHEADEKRAVDILSAHSAEDVHVHGLPEIHANLKELYLGAGSGGARQTYRGETFVRLDTGAYYAAGRIFPTETAVKTFLDRRIAMEALFAEIKPTGIKIADALRDPASVFGSPKDLLASDLSDPVKVELLKRWAYDAKQQQSATNEGMPLGPQGVTLAEVNNALLELQSRA